MLRDFLLILESKVGESENEMQRAMQVLGFVVVQLNVIGFGNISFIACASKMMVHRNQSNKKIVSSSTEGGPRKHEWREPEKLFLLMATNCQQ